METIKAPATSQAIKKVEKILASIPDTKRFVLCPVKDVLHSFTDKWSMLIIMVLGKHQTLRFNELKTAIDGISQKMLTATLKNLESSGMVNRKVYPQIPPKVEYTITALGTEFLQHLSVMLEWACTNSAVIAKNRKVAKRKVVKAA